MVTEEHDVPVVYRRLVKRRRFIVAIAFAVAGFASLVVSWVGVSGTTVIADQMSYIASGGLIGLGLIGVAGMMYWADQRDREFERFAELETYVFLIAHALGITADVTESEAAGLDGSTGGENSRIAAGV